METDIASVLLHAAEFLDVYTLFELQLSCQKLRQELQRVWVRRYITKFRKVPPEGSDPCRQYLSRPFPRSDGAYVAHCVYPRRIRNVGNVHLEEHERRLRRSCAPLLVYVEYERYFYLHPDGQCAVLRVDGATEGDVEAWIVHIAARFFNQLPPQKNSKFNNCSAYGRWRLRTPFVMVHYSDSNFDYWAKLRLEHEGTRFNSVLHWTGSLHMKGTKSQEDAAEAIHTVPPHFPTMHFRRFNELRSAL